MACSKRSYDSENLAVTALIEARIRFDNNTSCTVYQCDDCGQWHLTSKGNMHQKLKEALENGNINKQKQAWQWEKKIGY